mmetsp:Transcript_49738/g.116921  ORF Transcript_49738/g.116921 Transcript_49738/m.116921 type:complete len:89 (-) Transcript_49738:214-480(-)
MTVFAHKQDEKMKARLAKAFFCLSGVLQGSQCQVSCVPGFVPGARLRKRGRCAAQREFRSIKIPRKLDERFLRSRKMFADMHVPLQNH